MYVIYAVVDCAPLDGRTRSEDDRYLPAERHAIDHPSNVDHRDDELTRSIT